jgi:hypothetical protein
MFRVPLVRMGIIRIARREIIEGYEDEFKPNPDYGK